jgi:hypothetical protein
VLLVFAGSALADRCDGEELAGRFEQALAMQDDTHFLTSLVLEARQRKTFGRRIGDVMW